jgi:hypothetical protein
MTPWIGADMRGTDTGLLGVPEGRDMMPVGQSRINITA